MLKLNKTLLFACASIATSVAIVVPLTSCANNNPYADYTVGTSISIDSKKNADFAKDVAKSHIYVFEETFEWYDVDNGMYKNQRTIQNVSYVILTNLNGQLSEVDNVYASAQIYWELVYWLACNWSKNKNQSLTLSKKVDGVGDPTRFLSGENTGHGINLSSDFNLDFTGRSGDISYFGYTLNADNVFQVTYNSTSSFNSYALQNVIDKHNPYI